MSDRLPLNDSELLQLLRQDDAPAFQELYNRYWRKLYFLAHKRLKSSTAAEEIVQNVFLILWKKRKELQIADLGPYLAVVTRYAVYRWLGNEKRRLEKEQTAGKQFSREVAGEVLVDQKLLLEMVKQLTNELPEKCRLVFIYNKIEDQALPEVAQKLNISLKTAEAHLTKALRIIRKKAGDHVLFFFL